jgi:hypothetical protein
MPDVARDKNIGAHRSPEVIGFGGAHVPAWRPIVVRHGN